MKNIPLFISVVKSIFYMKFFVFPSFFLSSAYITRQFMVHLEKNKGVSINELTKRDKNVPGILPIP